MADNDADNGGTANNGNLENAQPANQNANGGGSSTEAADTFTQDQLDAVAEKSRKRGLAKGQADLLSELGLESVDDLKKALTDLDSLRQSQMTEAEKKDAELEKLTKLLDDEKKASQAVTEAANERLMRAAVMTEAAKAEHSIHEQARPDVWAFIDREALNVDKAGEVEGVEDAVKAVIADRPYLVDDGKQPPAAGTPRREPVKREQQPAQNSGRNRPTVRL